MNHKNWAFLVFFLIIFVAFLTPSCGKKEISSKPVMTEEEARRQAEEEARRREMEKQAAIQEESLKEESLSEERERIRTEREIFENEDVLFEFDSAKLSNEAQDILRKKAEWLKENPRARIPAGPATREPPRRHREGAPRPFTTSPTPTRKCARSSC